MGDREDIQELLERYRAAVGARDVDACLDLYDDEVRVFDLWNSWSFEGKAAWRANVGEWFGSLGTDQVAVELRDIETVVGEGVALVTAFVTYQGISAAGEQLRAMDNRLTWALRQQPGGGWRIVHEHTSAPAEVATGKVVLKR